MDFVNLYNAAVIILTTNFGDLLSSAAVIITVATLAGLGLQRGTVTNLREQLKDSREEVAEKDRRLKECDNESAKLQSDLDALARLKTGEAQFAEINSKLDTIVKGLTRQ